MKASKELQAIVTERTQMVLKNTTDMQGFINTLKYVKSLKDSFSWAVFYAIDNDVIREMRKEEGLHDSHILTMMHSALKQYNYDYSKGVKK